MKPLYIFDLDGTLALIRHRVHMLEWRDKEKWRHFYAACSKDEPNVPVIATLESLRRSGADVWIFSGRSDEVRGPTVEWLRKHTSFMASDFDSAFGIQDVLVMREEGDYTPDDVLKKQWYDDMLIDDKKRLVAVFEDRDRVVKMWRDAGVTCFQVAPGEF